MPTYDVQCQTCANIFEVLTKHGDWPTCACGGSTAQVWAGRMPAVIGDDVPGGFVIENLDKTPQTFYTKSAYRDALTARGLRLRDVHVGDPGEGSDKPRLLRDPQTGRHVRFNQKWF